MSVVSMEAIRAGLIERIDRLVPELYPAARRDGAEWVLGNVHGAAGTSLSIRRTGAKAGWWMDFGNRVDHGDLLTLIACAVCDGDVKAAVPWAVKWLGYGGMTPAEAAQRERAAAAANARRDRERAADTVAQRKRAVGHWHSAVPIPGTPADLYLLGRGIDIRALAKAPGSLRFKAMRCPETSTPERPVMRPCMLALVVNGISREPVAIHRTFLDVHPDGRVTKAAMSQAKRALGEYSGAFIPLTRGGSGKSLRHAPQGEPLVLSEGIEDGLSVALAMPGRRVGAALSLSNIGEVVVPAAIGGFYVAGQNDTNPTARQALARVRARLDERGIQALAAFPPAGVKDWNDWLVALQAGEPAKAEAVA